MHFFLLLKNIVFFFNISNRTTKNRIAIGQKTDPRRCASVPIMKKPISIGSVINLKKKPSDRAHPYCWVVLHGAGDDGSISHHSWRYCGSSFESCWMACKILLISCIFLFFFLFSLFFFFFGQPPLSTIYYLLALRFPIMLGGNTQQ